VLAQEILASKLLVQTEDMRRVMIDGADVLTVLKRGNGPKSRSERGPGEKGAETPRKTDTAGHSAPEKSPPDNDAPSV